MRPMAKEPNHSIPFACQLIAGIIVLVGMFLIAMVSGAAEVTIKDVWLALASDVSDERLSIIREIRLPREIAAIFVGVALGVSGAIMQGITRNPLADPGLLGVTAGANAALAVTIAFLPKATTLQIMLACFLGAAMGALMVFGIGALKKGGFSPFRIVLAGAAVSAFLVAVAEGIGITFKISKDISMWTAGGLIGTTWSQLHVIMPVIAAGFLLSLFFSRQLTILSLSEEVAIGLGQKTTTVKAILSLVMILLAGASVALVGNMAFLGLIVPHLVRAIVGTDYRFILPMSAIAGAAFMLAADTIGRTINSPYETPVVAVVAMMGLPFFLFIVQKGGRGFS